MKQRSRIQSLIGQVLKKRLHKVGSRKTTPAAKAVLSGGPPVKPVPKAIVKWLRKLPLNRSFRATDEIQVQYCLARGLVYPTVEKGWGILTREGLQAAWPWIVDVFYRADRQIWEGLCQHGCGHPIGFAATDKTAGIHGCDGCCNA